MGIELIQKYFTLNALQVEQFKALDMLYRDWNSKINVISRKDIDNLFLHHVLHSLGIAKVLNFTDGTSIVDVGTGGGFPGIPLAILFPKVKFHLIDSIGKKIKVAESIRSMIELDNVTTQQARMEDITLRYHFVVTRGTMPLADLERITRKNIAARDLNALPNGILALKGGNLQAEIEPYKHIASLFDLSDYFQEEFFETKHVVYVPIHK